MAPRLADRLPGARIRLAGRASGPVEPLGRTPGVTVVGAVDDMGTELEGADIVVVPLRRGSGTRLKILEAFAYGVPVVTTTVGCDGLDVDDGVHLLVADDPTDFPTRSCACAAMRRSGTGWPPPDERYRERYEAASARRAVRAVALAVSGAGDPGARR